MPVTDEKQKYPQDQSGGLAAAWTCAPITSSALDVVDTAVDSAARWLDIGRDVILRGESGAGRSTCLRKLVTTVARSGANAVLVDHRDLNLSTADRAAARARAGRPEPDLVRRIIDDLGPRGILLVDDLHHLDDQGMDMLDAVLAHTSARFVTTTTIDTVGHRSRALSRLLTDRGPAEVEIQPMDYQSMVRLVAGRLGGPADASLISSLVAWSAGNPDVALAVLDSARFTGVARQRHGTWTLVGDLDCVPMESVAHMLASDLDCSARSVLELLSALGPSTAEKVRQLVPDSALSELLDRGRVVLYRGQVPGGGDLMAVSPPALARALRNGLTESRRLELEGIVVGAVAGESAHPQLRDQLAASSPAADRSSARWAAQLTALVHERAVVEEAAARATWQRHPSVATALPYVEVLLRRPGSESAAEVFDGTVVGSDDDPDQVAMYQNLMRRWRVWHAPDGTTDPAGELPHPPGPVLDVVTTVQQAQREGWTDQVLADRLDLRRAGPTGSGCAQVRLAAAGALLAASRFDLVLDLTADTEDLPSWVPAEYRHYLAGIHSMALLFGGRVEDAEQVARVCLDRACDRLDLAGIRVHSLTLAHAMSVTGRREEAWQMLNTALRLGPPGPLGSTFYRRTLTLGAVLLARDETSDVARLLLDELRATRVGFRPVVADMRAVAEAYLLRAEGEAEQADELLWAEGARCEAEGWTAPAMEFWMLRTSAPTAEQAAAIRALADRAPMPMYGSLVDVHVALADPEPEALERAVRTAPLQIVPGLAATAVTALSAARVRAGGESLTEDEVVSLVGDRVAARLRNRPPHQAAVAMLSDREREIARMVTAGMTNRAIASRLYLSPRTVENHVHRTLRKFGVASRRDLPDVFSGH